jgi:hypothetical protein
VESGLSESALVEPGFAFVCEQTIADQEADTFVEDVRLAVVFVIFQKDMFDGVWMGKQIRVKSGNDSQANVIAEVQPGLGVKTERITAHPLQAAAESVAWLDLKCSATIRRFR